MSFIGWAWLALLFIFYRELISFSFELKSKSRKKYEESLRFRSGRRRDARVRLVHIKDLNSGLLFFPGWWRSEIFVEESLWNQLSNGEKQALLIWLSGQANLWTQWIYLILPPNVIKRDRQALFMGVRNLDLSSALEKLRAHRQAAGSLDIYEWLWLGWSPLGPSWTAAWPALPERIRRLSLEEAKWQGSTLSSSPDKVD